MRFWLIDVASAAAEAPCLRRWSFPSAACPHWCVFAGQWRGTSKLLWWGSCGSTFCGFVLLPLGVFMPTGSSGLAVTWGWAMDSRSPGELSSSYQEQTGISLLTSQRALCDVHVSKEGEPAAWIVLLHPLLWKLP